MARIFVFGSNLAGRHGAGALLPRLNGGGRKQNIAYDTAPAELKPTLMAVAKLEHRLHEKQQS